MSLVCLQTVVQNTSGHERSFGYLPPHGKRLGVDEIVEIDGNLFDRINARGGPAKRMMDSLKRDIANGVIKIISTPGALVQDATTGNTKILGLDNSVVTVNDPCWV
jgi:hypothetical protein